MTVPNIEVKEPIVHHGRLAMPYRHSAGIAGSIFIRGLMKKKIMAVKCPACNLTYVPPKTVCTECFGQMEEWVELEGKGTLLTYSEINYPMPAHPLPPPFIIGSVRVDGADTALIHIIGEVDIENIMIGMKVEPVFRENPQGSILDIKHFKPF